MSDLHQQLFEKGLIEEKQFMLLDSVKRKKVISLYYDLRLVLYLGIMLLTGGLGYIIYDNLGEVGHYLLMFSLAIGIGVGSRFIYFKAKPYSTDEVEPNHVYFAYVVLLVALLIISLFTYIQIYFELDEVVVQWASFATSTFFLFLAYRYDNKMLLSLGITAIAPALALSMAWVVDLDYVDSDVIPLLALVFGMLLYGIGSYMNFKKIKRHFTFTYHNFALLVIYYLGLYYVFGYFGKSLLHALLLLIFSSFFAFYTWQNKAFLFFLYSIISAYICVTSLFFLLGMDWEFGLFYFPATCITGVVFLLRNKAHFSDD